MAKICIVSTGQLATNPRLVKEANALASAGHEVEVVVCQFSRWAQPMEDSVPKGGWTVAARVPFGPLAPLTCRLRQGVRKRIAKKILALGLKNARYVEIAAHPASLELIRAASSIKADLYIGHYVAALPAVATAAQRHNAHYAFDAEDFHLGDSPEGPEGEWQRSITRAIEGRYIPNCAYVTAASPGIADAYADAYGIPRPTVVLNVFPLEQTPERPTPRGSVQPGPSVYWFSQTIGPNRGLECAVRAIAMAQSEPHLYLRGTPAEGYAEVLNRLVESEGCTGRVHILPPAEPLEMERLAAQYDVGLVGETGHTLNRRIALTNKQFTYLLAGIPSIMSDVPAHREFAKDLAPAVTLYKKHDPKALALALDSLLMNQGTLSAAREAAYRLGQERYNWECEQKSLIQAVESSLDGH